MIENSWNPALLDASEARKLRPAQHLTAPTSAPSSVGESFGARVRRLRVNQRLSQTDLAAALDVSVPAVSGWEKDRSRPRHDRFDALSNILGVTVAELLGTDLRSFATDLFAENRAQIAHAVGTTPDKVRIIIEF